MPWICFGYLFSMTFHGHHMQGMGFYPPCFSSASRASVTTDTNLPSDAQRVVECSKLASPFEEKPEFLTNKKTDNMKAKKKKQPMPIRTCRVTIRLTEADRTMFKDKANASFNGNISKLIFTAVSLYKNDRMKSKYATAQRFADLYDQLLPELKKGGTNLNQVAHQLNAAMLQYMGEPPADWIRQYLDKRLNTVLTYYAGLLWRLGKAHDKIVNDLVKAK